MERFAISKSSAVSNDVELNVNGGTYDPISRSVSITTSDIDSFNIATKYDEVLMVGYSGRTILTPSTENYCSEQSGETVMLLRDLPIDDEDNVVAIHSGIVQTKIRNTQEIFFSVTDDISDILEPGPLNTTSHRTIANNRGEIVSDVVREYKYVRYFIRRRHIVVPIGLSMNIDYLGMNSESNINTIVEEAKEGLVPGVIDMEKIKFSPVWPTSNEKGTVYEKVNKLIIRLNFLHRDAWTTESGYNGNSVTAKYIRTNSFAIDNFGWYTDDYLGNTSTNILESRIDGSATLLGYMGFTDDDVRFQKNKLAKSFLRISYYSTNDPITNSLLNYSTVFMDSGELFGKYVRIEKDKEFLQGIYEDEALYQYIHTLSSGKTRLDFTIDITDEYDDKKSGEGFNIYLFSDDFKYVTETDPITIYMKVEFNHAGFGKIFQMMRPIDVSEWGNGKEVKDYLAAVFIPINVFYDKKSGRFVYAFRDKSVAYNDGVIYLDLYEATITKQNENGKNLCD